MGFEDIVILDDSPDDLIQITNQEKVSFNETEKNGNNFTPRS